LKIISDHFITTPERMKAFSALNPQRIYVENVRALLGTNSWIAKQICETAVRQGLFVKRIQVLCPDGGVAVTVSDEGAIPPNVLCWREVDGELEETVESTDRLDKLEFYQLARAAA
jgi:hypothetical protein